jgi:hypothetical protein
MPEKSEIIAERQAPEEASSMPLPISKWRSLLEIALVLGLILLAVWTPPGRLNSLLTMGAALSVVVIAVAGRWDAHQMGLGQPLAGAGAIVLAGSALCAVIAAVGLALRFAGSSYPIPLDRSWQYAIWALVQEFILQSIFFLRFESIVGSRRAGVLSASLYAVAHIPSPVLTVLSFLGGLFFCEFFRRWRNLYPIGLIHAALGLTIAASLPDHWLHHMRVGIGYLATR